LLSGYNAKAIIVPAGDSLFPATDTATRCFPGFLYVQEKEDSVKGNVVVYILVQTVPFYFVIETPGNF
jgi:hypothetical protein